MGAHEGRAGRGPSRAVLRGFESFEELPKTSIFSSLLIATKKEIEEAQILAIHVEAPLRIAPQLRAQGHVEARRKKVVRLRGYAAKDCLAVRRDAAARRQWLATVGAGAAKVLDLL